MRTVRAKLIALAGLPVMVLLVVLPLIVWLLHVQLVAQITERTANAGRSYQVELDDDITDIRLAAEYLSISPSVRAAVDRGDVASLATIMNAYAALYPDIDIAVYGRGGVLLTQIGCAAGGPPLGDPPFVSAAGTQGDLARLDTRGCDPTPLPTYLIGKRIAGGGVVVTGLDFSSASVARTAKKLGVELSLVTGHGEVVQRTAGFPAHASRDFIEQSFAPKQFAGVPGALRFVAAHDVRQVRAGTRRTAFEVAGFVVPAALVLGAIGLGLAGRMSSAVRSLSAAFRRLEVQDYALVEGVRTGDELEDLAQAFNHATVTLSERDRLRTTFGKYMTQAVMEHLLAGKVQLGGELLTATVVFSDIRSFTSISEKMDARSLVSLLNEYFTEMVEAITREDGVVDKYIGDAIMAVFGAPVPRPDDAVRAVRAAIGMREALAHLNERLAKRGVAPIRTGIGVSTGEVVAGNIGSERRMEYTVMGDAVTVAMELEHATKELGQPVLISESTYHAVHDHVALSRLQTVIVKGHASPIMVYAVKP